MLQQPIILAYAKSYEERIINQGGKRWSIDYPGFGTLPNESKHGQGDSQSSGSRSFRQSLIHFPPLFFIMIRFGELYL